MSFKERTDQAVAVTSHLHPYRCKFREVRPTIDFLDSNQIDEISLKELIDNFGNLCAGP
jgi:hypothetical protein